MLFTGELWKYAGNSNFWQFWECPLFDIREYTFKFSIFTKKVATKLICFIVNALHLINARSTLFFFSPQKALFFTRIYFHLKAFIFLPNIHMKCHTETIVIEKVLSYTKKSHIFYWKSTFFYTYFSLKINIFFIERGPLFPNGIYYQQYHTLDHSNFTSISQTVCVYWV